MGQHTIEPKMPRLVTTHVAHTESGTSQSLAEGWAETGNCCAEHVKHDGQHDMEEAGQRAHGVLRQAHLPGDCMCAAWQLPGRFLMSSRGLRPSACWHLGLRSPQALEGVMRKAWDKDETCVTI